MLPPDSSSKGSLEDLFRHHLLESTAASVPPAPHVWEQVENSLLLQENLRYRRRLRTSYWAMAASLLLAALLGGGWWQSQRARPAATLASAPGYPADAGRARPAAGPVTTPATIARVSTSTATTPAIDQNVTLSAPTANLTTYSLAASQHPVVAAATRPISPIQSLRTGYYQVVVSLAEARVLAQLRAGTRWTSRSAGLADDRPADAGSLVAAGRPAGAAGNADPADEAGQLAARQAGLRLPLAQALPTRLAATGPGWQRTPTRYRPTSPWQLQVAYAGSVFNPNIDFRKAPSEYDGSLGPGTVATTSDAAAEYRQNLRAGLGQRLSVWASRRLGIGRWHLRTGLEINQNMASSSSSVDFVGNQVQTLDNYRQVQSNKLRTTTYRYYTLSVPLEATYHSAGRRGFSLYGRAGAAASALLGVRSEVAGSPEATLTYSYRNPLYRSLNASVRGGVGVRYQPATHPWTVTLGPVADAGVLSLNLDPAQDFWNQQRPYSFGLEAGVELGSWLKPVMK